MVNQDHELWHKEDLTNEYIWRMNGMGQARGTTTVEEKTRTITMRRQSDGVLWAVESWDEETTVEADANKLQQAARKTGVTFKPHPLSAAIPWTVAPTTRPRSVLKMIDKRRRQLLHKETTPGLAEKLEKIEQAGQTHQWTRAMQSRSPRDLWLKWNCVSTFQTWVAYRDATMQLNLFHDGRVTDNSCPVQAMCGHTKETIPHIMWDCNRARAVWRLLFEKWTGHQANETLRDMMLPHIASRKPPSSTRSIRQRILARFGFFTPEHAHALKTIWFIVCSVIPSCLWRQRNATVHERLKASVVDCRDHTWRTCVRQVMAVTRKRRRMRGKAFESIAMREIIQVLDQPEEALEAPGWNNARLYFDGGARGNPGPGGSGWALVTQDAQSLEWSVTACGYKYKGSYVTNNVCEYGALQDGVEYARTALEGTHTHLAIHGDSNMIIDERNGLATITAPQLQKHAVAVDNIVSHLAWASWTHVRREHNKMADFLANVAMDSRGRRTLTPSTRDSEATRFHQVQTLMKNDMNCVASQIRTGSLTRVIKRFLDS